MAKQLIKNYAYSKSGKTVTFSDYSTIRLDSILLVVDATVNTIMYNFADATVATGTVATNVLTLSAVPSSSADADKLLIFYDAKTGDTTYDQTPTLDANSAAMKTDLDTLAGAVGSSKFNVNISSSGVTVPISVGNGLSRIQTQSGSLTTSVTAYTAGDQLGAEMTWANAAASSGGTFTILSATLTDAAKNVGSVDLFLFDRTGVSHAGDNAANAWSDADILKSLGVISFPPPIFSANNSIATVPYVGLSCKLNSGETTLYGVMVTRIGHTFFGAATDVAITLTVQRD